ncbi:MSMEG_0565 family glycosyltransferase [Humisphaera borealis]|uniref:MSMEG_0565 family glycosyltransferase n=1 Tax=Humisphaera borealis TaxID=2807512 RepID=A0A7M2WVX7_9BACT|nr:MSMEG_0565 family glycosyltransferase [Humisphaera borealis]QOV89678.1 MSMEG_0565 family glycosyltransferase [Humisphaera borealis]
MSRPLRIGLFTHSTNPRGGVVHCLELGEALAQLGHDVTVHAPAEAGRRFFRPPVLARHVLVPARAVKAALPVVVRQRIQEYVDYVANGNASFDIFHAHDGISGGALADLTEAGLIEGFVRTVHHLDQFEDPYLDATQSRSVQAARQCLCVSSHWRGALFSRYGVDATTVPNGVNLSRFDPTPTDSDGPLRDKLMEGGRAGPFFLAVGGIERRKNTVNILRAFLEVRQSLSRAVLVIAGGASLLDHSDYRREFDAVVAAAGPDAANSVVITGAMSDDQMASAYRIADALVFPSTVEGFGLAVLEAMASGTPVITSRMPPFTEYLDDSKAILVDPHDPGQIAAAMLRVFDPSLRHDLRSAGLQVSVHYSWQASAAAHMRAYGGVAVTPSPTDLKGEPNHAGNAVSSSLAG